jgi:hypothetical protein
MANSSSISLEGFEDEVLLGLRDTIRRFRPLVSFEYSGQSKGRAWFEAMRSALAGYEIYEPFLKPSSASATGKILFYLKHALNPGDCASHRAGQSILSLPDCRSVGSKGQS